MMEEFEKWNDSLPILEKRYQSLERKKAWRAALGMVFEWLDYSTEHEEIKDKIQKELGDT